MKVTCTTTVDIIIIYMITVTNECSSEANTQSNSEVSYNVGYVTNECSTEANTQSNSEVSYNVECKDEMITTEDTNDNDVIWIHQQNQQHNCSISSTNNSEYTASDQVDPIMNTNDIDDNYNKSVESNVDTDICDKYSGISNTNLITSLLDGTKISRYDQCERVMELYNVDVYVHSCMNDGDYIRMDDHVINNALFLNAVDQVINDISYSIVDRGSSTSESDRVTDDVIFSSPDVSTEGISTDVLYMMYSDISVPNNRPNSFKNLKRRQRRKNKRIEVHEDIRKFQEYEVKLNQEMADRYNRYDEYTMEPISSNEGLRTYEEEAKTENNLTYFKLDTGTQGLVDLMCDVNDTIIKNQVMQDNVKSDVAEDNDVTLIQGLYLNNTNCNEDVIIAQELISTGTDETSITSEEGTMNSMDQVRDVEQPVVGENTNRSEWTCQVMHGSVKDMKTEHLENAFIDPTVIVISYLDIFEGKNNCVILTRLVSTIRGRSIFEKEHVYYSNEAVYKKFTMESRYSKKRKKTSRSKSL